MLRSLAADAHCLGRTVQPLLHRVKNGLMLPSLYAPFFGGCAFGFQSAAGARGRLVAMQREPILDGRAPARQFLAGGATVGVFLGIINEIRLTEPPLCL